MLQVTPSPAAVATAFPGTLSSALRVPGPASSEPPRHALTLLDASPPFRSRRHVGAATIPRAPGGAAGGAAAPHSAAGPRAAAGGPHPRRRGRGDRRGGGGWRDD